jgi:hypothetical protein
MGWRHLAVVVVAGAITGCGGSGGAAGPSTPLLSVAGAYEIRKTIVSDTCGGSSETVSNPGEVRHTPGARAFVLNDHGTRDLPGTVDTDGSFSLEPSRGLVGGVVPAVDTFEGGRFTTAGFGVRVTTDLEAAAGNAACRVVTQWDGAKQGTPNVIP